MYFAGTPPGDASEKPDHRSDLYYREDRKAENPQPHMPVRQDTDTDNMFEYLDIIYGFFDDIFDYKSFNDNNATISAMTHYGRGYCNAFWNGAHLVFGAGMPE